MPRTARQCSMMFMQGFVLFMRGEREAGRCQRRSLPALPDPVVVEVHTAAGGLGRIEEEGVAVAHEVRDRVGKARGPADRSPGLAVEAVGEAGDLGGRLEFAFDLQMD